MAGINLLCYYFLVACSPEAPSMSPSLSTSLPTPVLTDQPISISDEPSISPSLMATDVPSSSPNITSSPSPPLPSSSPFATETSLPTLFEEPGEKLTVNLVYKLRVKGFNATDILTGRDNNIADDLIVGVTTVILSILNQSLPSPPKPPIDSLFLPETDDNEGGNDSNDLVEGGFGSLRGRRSLAAYSPLVPPFHSNVLQDVCDTVDDIHECVLVKTVVTVFLEPDESPDEVRLTILSGFNKALVDGTFFKALP